MRIAALLFLLCCLLAAACSPATRLGKLQGRHPAQVAAACALFYPTKDSISIRTQYLPGKEVLIPGPVVVVDCDSAVAVANAKAGNSARPAVLVPCPPADTVWRVDTFSSDTYNQQESSAKLEAQRLAFQAQINDLQKACADAVADGVRWKAGRSTWRLIALLLIGYTAARVILKYYFKINFLP